MYNVHGGYTGKRKVVDYSININPLGVSELLKEKLCSDIEELEKYPQIGGESTKELLSEKIKVDKDSLIIGNGATELIYLFSRALDIKCGLVVEPTFTEYAKSVEIIGGKVKRYSLEQPGFSLDVAALLEGALRESAQAVYICSPNNPTGGVVGKEKIEELLKGLGELGIYLFLDESFIEFSDRESAIDLIIDYKLFVLRSVTKIYGVPGIRIGYGAGNREIIERMNQFKEPWSVNAMALKTLETYLYDEDYRKSTDIWYRAEKKRFTEALSEIECMETLESDANFLLCRLKHGKASALQSYLAERGFYIRTCEDFYGLDESYIRLAIRRQEENENLLEAIKKYRGGD